MSTTSVSPVVSYDPPIFSGPATLPPVIVSPRHDSHLSAAVLPIGPDSKPAAAFADTALRRVLEVIDRRRPLAQLRPLLAPGLVESLLTGPAADGGSARLRRVVAQPVTMDGATAEVAANYSRGDRVHAIACRVEQVPTPTGPRWQVVALHLG
jgi:hypothetical protein